MIIEETTPMVDVRKLVPLFLLIASAVLGIVAISVPCAEATVQIIDCQSIIQCVPSGPRPRAATLAWEGWTTRQLLSPWYSRIEYFLPGEFLTVNYETADDQQADQRLSRLGLIGVALLAAIYLAYAMTAGRKTIISFLRRMVRADVVIGLFACSFVTLFTVAIFRPEIGVANCCRYQTLTISNLRPLLAAPVTLAIWSYVLGLIAIITAYWQHSRQTSSEMHDDMDAN